MNHASTAFAPMVLRIGLVAVAGSLASTPVRAELKVGDPAPTFEAEATLAGEPFRFVLADALKKGPVVLYFYPKAFTQGCTIEANRFAEAAPDYAKLGATVIGISGDDIETLNRFSVTECRNRFAVASDRGGRIMKAYDARMPLSETYAKRVSYVISPEGRIVHAISSMGPEEHVPSTLGALERWAAAQQGTGGDARGASTR